MERWPTRIRTTLALAALALTLIAPWALGQDPDTITEIRLQAEQGDADAQYNLGYRYVTGIGVPQDRAEAVRWLRLAADQGHTQASVVAWIGAEMEFALSQAVASGDTFERRPSECGHCVQNFLADLDLRDLPGEAAGFELGADDTLPTADLRFYPAALIITCCRLLAARRTWQ